ncbi:MAG: hypothetical protein KJ066_13180 [Acidobacteria bacterium]|nr:hypothetical protein [Acidobacteriota bacterium]
MDRPPASAPDLSVVIFVRIWWRLRRGVYDAGLDHVVGPAASGDGRR